ncbi:MAG TPA: hypothetical protein VK806_12880 [Bacteroidia bacterium]|jgi:antitoxin component YwqK of YwqJK toxin-antitoxin module|nr:hypothetical protein [Bacteroidia bacterium]
MKPLLTLILFLSLGIAAFGQDYPDSGFTNKAEAKNLMVNGLKEGKWIEYADDKGFTEDTTAPYYLLIVYKKGKTFGITRLYVFGRLHDETPYVNGIPNGTEKTYNDDGTLRMIVTFRDGKRVKITDGTGKEIKQ